MKGRGGCPCKSADSPRRLRACCDQTYTAAAATYKRAGYAQWTPPAPDLLHWDTVDRSAVLMHKHLFPLDVRLG